MVERAAVVDPARAGYYDVVTHRVGADSFEDTRSRYHQAAELTGYRIIEVPAGETVVYFKRDDEFRGHISALTVEEGYVGIVVERPKGELDHTAFWQKYQELAGEPADQDPTGKARDIDVPGDELPSELARRVAESHGEHDD